MRHSYNKTFKDEAVALALGSNEPVSKVAVDLGLNSQASGYWVRKALERDLRKAKKELALKEKKIVVLKKATAYFAKDHV